MRKKNWAVCFSGYSPIATLWLANLPHARFSFDCGYPNSQPRCCAESITRVVSNGGYITIKPTISKVFTARYQYRYQRVDGGAGFWGRKSWGLLSRPEFYSAGAGHMGTH